MPITPADSTDTPYILPGAQQTPGSPWTPLKMPVFRLLWGTWATANICMWMSDVAAAWMMSALTTTPLWVALVQTASTLPVFLLGLPSGALADILDRRRYFIVTQFWLAGTAAALCLALLFDLLTPPLLLALTFANGIGLAMRWPIFAALIPEIVPRQQLPAALALNAIGMNASRIIGPLVAGALIASAGIAYVFVLNATLSMIAGFVIMRWRRDFVPSPLGRERLLSAMRVGLQFVRESAPLRGVFLRVSLFFFHSTALLALLPLLARRLAGGGAATYTLLLAAMGVGAIMLVLVLPRLRQRLTSRQMVLAGTVLQSLSTMVMAFAPSVYVAVPTMVLAGMAWLCAANSLSLLAQMLLPNWVRARGMSMFQMAIMGGSALGAAVWGQVATMSSLNSSLVASALTGSIAMLVATRLLKDELIEEDLTPSRAFNVPVAPTPPSSGHVMVTIEYLIDPERAAAFLQLMQESRSSRLRQGALNWELLHDLGEPQRYLEQIVDESWTEHLRRFDRTTAADVALRDRKLAFHLGDEPPKITRYAMSPTQRAQAEGS
jgi:MFS family permease